jgi:hypothetical protein
MPLSCCVQQVVMAAHLDRVDLSAHGEDCCCGHCSQYQRWVCSHLICSAGCSSLSLPMCMALRGLSTACH